MYDSQGKENKKELITIETNLSIPHEYVRFTIKTGDPKRNSLEKGKYSQISFKKNNTPINDFTAFFLASPRIFPNYLSEKLFQITYESPLYEPVIWTEIDFSRMPGIKFFPKIKKELINRRLIEHYTNILSEKNQNS